jgi:hypothetical protein
LCDLDFASLPVPDPSERLLGPVTESLSFSGLTVFAGPTESALLRLGVVRYGLFGRVPSESGRLDLDGVIGILVNDPVKADKEVASVAG